MKAAFLPDRRVVKVNGDGARDFLNGLVTSDVTLLRPGLGRFGALLTPQGKITADFLITEAPPGLGGGFLIDCPRALAQPLTDKLGFYKLRAKVAIENLSDSLGVLAAWDGEPSVTPDLAFTDPRNPALGCRILVPEALAQKVADLIGAERLDSAAYEAHRIATGVPRGGLDFSYGDAFPHETNMDRLHGVDFEKGCYVGQEVVSRMQHRSTARTRTVRGALDGFAPAEADRRMSRSARRHADGLTRCPWPGEDPFYIAYHDTEWGVPEYDDRALFEKLVLDGFQAGLSWITILRKRENFRNAFDDFHPEKIARYNAKKLHALMNDVGIVRNRANNDDTVASAKSYLKIMEEGPGFSTFLCDFVDGAPKVNHFKTTASVP